MIAYGKNVRRGYEPDDTIGLHAEKALLDLGAKSNLPNIMDFLKTDCNYGKDYGVHLATNGIMHELAKLDISSFEYAKEVCWVLNEVEQELAGVKVEGCKNYFVAGDTKNQIGSIIKNCVSAVTEKTAEAKKQFNDGFYIPGEYYYLLQKVNDVTVSEVAKALYTKSTSNSTVTSTTKLRRAIQKKVLKELNISDKYIELLVGENTYSKSKKRANTLSTRIRYVKNYVFQHGKTEPTVQDLKNHWVFQYTPKNVSDWSRSFAHTYVYELRLMHYYIQNGLLLDDKLPALEPVGFKKYTGVTTQGRSYTKYRIDGNLFKKHFNLILAYYIHVYCTKTNTKYSGTDAEIVNFIKSYNGDDELVRAIKMSV